MENKQATFNSSLSARIRRRNQGGFEGTGNYNGIEKDHVYGNYNDPKDNHKDKDKNDQQKFLIHSAQQFGCRHAGSKNIKKLKLYETSTAAKEIKKFREKLAEAQAKAEEQKASEEAEVKP